MFARGDDIFVVELEGFDRRSPSRSSTMNKQAVLAPSEMFEPSLCAGIEERERFAASRVDAVSSCAFVTVAQGTGQPEIGDDSRPAD